jgi:thiol-disulfide isomerase/thioredoxin
MHNPTRRHWLRRSGGLGLALALSSARAQTPPPADSRAAALPAIGSLLALPEVPMLDGSLFRPAAAEGQVLVLYWWASWCPFCAQQSPLMDQLWRAQAGRGLLMLGLSIDKTPEPAAAYLRQRGYTFPSGWVSPAVARVLPKPKGLPVTVVRGRDGRVLMAEPGQLFPEDVAEIARFMD